MDELSELSISEQEELNQVYSRAKLRQRAPQGNVKIWLNRPKALIQGPKF